MNIKYHIILILFLFSRPLFSQTTVPGGTIDGATWTAAGSPYHVTGNLQIRNLIIEAGVEVLFDGNYDFEIEDILVARGTYNDSIIFKSAPGNSSGWRGLLYTVASTTNELRYCRIENASADAGVHVDGSTLLLRNCDLMHNDNDGLRLKDAYVTAYNCRFTDNGVNGVYTDRWKTTLFNCIIARNNQQGIFISDSNDSLLVVNSVIVDNGSTGLFSNDGTCLLRNSIIYDNETSINYSGIDPLVDYCDVEGGYAGPGTGNITTIPGFIGTEFYSLAHTSFCIDNGDPTAQDNDRYFPPSQGFSRNDMGAQGGPAGGRWFNPLYIQPLSIDFGNVRRDSSISADIIVKNYSDTVLTVSDISFLGTDADNYSVDTTSFSLAVYDSLPVAVSFTPDRSGLFSAYMRLESDQARDSVSLTGRGVVPNIYISDDQLDFDDVTLGDSSALSFTITNTGTDTLTINDILTSTFYYIVGLNDSVIPPAQNQDVTVLFKPDTSRLYQDTITIHSNDPDPGDNPYAIALTGTGKGPLISVDTGNINFNRVRVAQDSLISFIITNLGNADLIVDTIDIVSEKESVFSVGNAVFPMIITPAEGSATLAVRYAPSVREQNSGQLSIVHNDMLADTVKIMLNGQGIAPELTLTVDTLYFGKVAVDSSETKNFYISNTGEIGLKINKLELIKGNMTSFELNSNLPSDSIIAAHEAALIEVSFKPPSADSLWSQIDIESNDPITTNDSVTVTGYGAKPIIWFQYNTVDFGRIAINDDSIQNIYIKNMGDATLFINKEEVSVNNTREFLCFMPKDIVLAPDSSSEALTVTFSPQDTGLFESDLNVSSNDKAKSPATIKLTGRGYDPSQAIINVETGDSGDTLHFGRIIVHGSSERKVEISNGGDKKLSVTGMRVTGSDAFGFKSADTTFELQSNQKKSVAIIFDSEMPLGMKTAHLQIESNDEAGKSLYIVYLVAESVRDESPASIRLDPASGMLTAGRADTLKFSIRDNDTDIDSAAIFLRKGGEKHIIPEPQKMNPASGDAWIAFIPNDMVTARGLEYVVEACHGGSTTTFPEKGFNAPAALTVAIPSMSFPEKTLKNYYQMISIPFDVQGKSLADLFDDDLGIYDNKRYRIFDWQQQNETYVELTTLDTSLPPGKALWLITREEIQLDVTDGVSLPTDTSYTINLLAGWNMIGHPFAFPVSWDMVNSSSTLYYYSGQGWLETNILEPFEGYAFFADQDTVIQIPPVEINLQQKISTHKLLTGNDWRVKFSAVKGVYHDRDNYVGFSRNGRQRRVPEPPTIGDAVSLFCVDEGKPQERYSAYYEHKEQAGHRFTIRMSSNFSGKTCISVVPENLPDDFDWVVVSPELKIKYPKDDIITEQKDHLFQILVGTEDYLRTHLQDYHDMPRTFDLAQNFPNPFNPITTIKYQVPKLTKVNLAVYDLLGRRVITLAKDALKEPGYYQLQWNGQNQRGDRVASGLYILTLQADTYYKAIKMILQK